MWSSSADRRRQIWSTRVKAVGRLEGELAAASRKYTYLQDTRGFIADVCDMLQVLVRY